jgi:hypothetical protein
MIGLLTYPPKIIIESSIDLPSEYDMSEGLSVEVRFELTMVVTELVLALADKLS